jgi:hypothetical protein
VQPVRLVAFGGIGWTLLEVLVLAGYGHGRSSSRVRLEAPVLRQHWRKAAARSARARIIALEFPGELCIDANDAVAALDAGLANGNAPKNIIEHQDPAHRPYTALTSD